MSIGYFAKVGQLFENNNIIDTRNMLNSDSELIKKSKYPGLYFFQEPIKFLCNHDVISDSHNKSSGIAYDYIMVNDDSKFQDGFVLVNEKK